ncbi:hypothetical protein BKA07_000709 [Brevibacterium marinum]|uniref:Uncharacterized protein n=1 Tax=Brevibacterium marinum TaxID=418643 RepID=A0A846RP40_9MICO|nr:hypothetical protein [Brevibacterium marinum]
MRSPSSEKSHSQTINRSAPSTNPDLGRCEQPGLHKGPTIKTAPVVTS